MKGMFLEAHLNNGLPLPKQDILKELATTATLTNNHKKRQTPANKTWAS
jgi:hypothetical protein